MLEDDGFKVIFDRKLKKVGIGLGLENVSTISKKRATIVRRRSEKSI